MSQEYENGYIHGAAFARLTIAINAASDALGFFDTDQARQAVSLLVEARNELVLEADKHA